jgi:hypothetical protein
VRLAQRIPVRIHIDQVPEGVVLAAGMTATVQIEPRPRPSRPSEPTGAVWILARSHRSAWHRSHNGTGHINEVFVRGEQARGELPIRIENLPRARAGRDLVTNGPTTGSDGGRRCLGHHFSSPGRHVFHGRCDASYQMQVVAVVFPAITRSVDEGAHDGDAEPTDRAFFCRRIQIEAGMGERIERWPVVDEIDRQRTVPPAERDGDTARRRSHPAAVSNNIGEKLFEDDEQPRPFVIGKTTIASELLGKGFEPNELGSLAP